MELVPKTQLGCLAAPILAGDQCHVVQQTDRLFGALMLFQWFAAIVVALWTSHRGASAVQSYAPIWMAICQGGVISLLPLVLVFVAPGRAVTRHVTAAAQMLMSGL